MGNQSQNPSSKSVPKNSAQQETHQNPALASGGLALLMRMMGALGSGSIDSQSPLLQRQHLSETYRQNLAQRIGSVQGNQHLLRLVAQPAALQRQGEPTAEAEKTEKRYTVKLSTGERSNLTEGEAIAVLFEAYDALKRQIELDEGEHKSIQKNRDDDPFIGLGGWLTDLMGEDFPATEMWNEPKQHMVRAQAALWTKNIEAAGNHLAEAHKAYTDCRNKWNAYKDQLPNAGTKAQVAIVVVAVIAVVVITVAAGVAGGGAAAGGTSAGGGTAAGGGAAAGGAATGGAVAGGEAAVGGAATAGGATAAGGTASGAAAAGGAATGGVVVGGGVSTAATAATTLPGVSLVNTLITEVGAALASGNGARALAILSAYASTPSGRQTLLKCAEVVTVHMQQPGLTQREFQMLKQIADSFYQFARGG